MIKNVMMITTLGLLVFAVAACKPANKSDLEYYGESRATVIVSKDFPCKMIMDMYPRVKFSVTIDDCDSETGLPRAIIEKYDSIYGDSK